MTIGEQVKGHSVSSVPGESGLSPAVTPMEKDITASNDIYALCDIEDSSISSDPNFRLPLMIGEQVEGRSVSSVPGESGPSFRDVSMESKPVATDMVSRELRSSTGAPLNSGFYKATYGK